MSDSVIELTERGLRSRRGKKWGEYPEDVYPAWIADMDFLTAEPIRAALAQITADADFVYGTQPSQVAEAFANRMGVRFSWQIDPGDVVVVADLVQAVTAALLAFSQQGDGVLITSPSYPPLIAAIAATNRRMVDVPLLDGVDGPRLDLAAIRAAVASGSVSILLLCNPHNPTGTVFGRAELTGLAEIVAGTDVVVISDEIHADLVYAGEHHIPFATLDPQVARRTVTTNSVTKSFNLGGLRCGVLHLGADLVETFHQTHPDRILGRINNLGAEASIVAWSDCQPWLDSLMTRLDENRLCVQEWVDQTPGISWTAPGGTYFAWLDCSGLDLGGSTASEYFLTHARVALSDGATFGAEYARFARLNFATSPTILQVILGRLSDAVGAGVQTQVATTTSDSAAVAQK